MSGLALSPDGTRLVTAVSTLDAKRTRYVTALWEVDPEGVRPARRLTRSAKGESAARFASTGDLLFTSARPDADDDERLLGARKDAKVAAILHSSYPVRYWDHDLGPARPRLFAGDLTTVAASPEAGAAAPRLALRDLAPDAGAALEHQDAVLSPDGRTLVTSWAQPGARGTLRQHLVAVDVATGTRRVLVDDPTADLAGPVVSPDSRRVAYVRETITTPTAAPQVQLWVADLDAADPAPRRVAAGWDRWPHEIAWTRDGAGLLVGADHLGRGPVFHVALDSGAVTQVTADDAVFSDLRVSPDGATLYALRVSY